jgi:hypothetical protein
LTSLFDRLIHSPSTAIIPRVKPIPEKSGKNVSPLKQVFSAAGAQTKT